jgi:hypothetical protein
VNSLFTEKILFTTIHKFESCTPRQFFSASPSGLFTGAPAQEFYCEQFATASSVIFGASNAVIGNFFLWKSTRNCKPWTIQRECQRREEGFAAEEMQHRLLSLFLARLSNAHPALFTKVT